MAIDIYRMSAYLAETNKNSITRVREVSLLLSMKSIYIVSRASTSPTEDHVISIIDLCCRARAVARSEASLLSRIEMISTNGG